MGVAGLWDILRPAGQTRSLTHLAVVDGFEKNPNGLRGFRIGIDASIWFFHAAYGKEGENPELRTLFFRCATLMRAPFLPLFIFDGPMRPSMKRGKKVSGNAHWLTIGMKNIIEAFGFEWRTAPGEAEAELAYLNRIGVIDGILSDDVDNFLFGAKLVIRNSSNTLSGNRVNPIKNSAGKDDKNHSVVYSLKRITEHTDVGLTRGGLILIGLLSGGDYHQAGLSRCGIKTAHGLAKCGFGDSLYEAASALPRHELHNFLSSWREDLRRELLTNSQDHLGRKHIALAKSVPDDFPNIDILLSYTNPITSETQGRAVNNLKITWRKEPDLGKLANVCELYFEWGVKETIIKRFRTIIWPSAILRILRRRVLDSEAPPEGIKVSSTLNIETAKDSLLATPTKGIAKYFSSMQLNTPSSAVRENDDSEGQVIIKIHSARTHPSTDGILEYRLEIDPENLVHLCEAGITGIRPPITEDEWAEDDEGDEDGKAAPPDPLMHFRMWAPASIVRIVESGLVSDFEGVRERKRAKHPGKKKTTKVTAKAEGSAAEQDQRGGPSKVKVACTGPVGVGHVAAQASIIGWSDSDDLPCIDSCILFSGPKEKSTPLPITLRLTEPKHPHISNKHHLSSLDDDPFTGPSSQARVFIPVRGRLHKRSSPECNSPCSSPTRSQSPLDETSPRIKRTSRSRLPKNIVTRPGSPTPILRLTKSSPSLTPPEFMGVIEISSDSDTSPSKPTVPPLLAARAKANCQRETLLKSQESATERKISPKVVIDLT